MAGMLVAASTACGYQSTYVPPDDGRYRVVWRGDRLETVGPASIQHCSGDEIVERPPGLVATARSEPESTGWAGLALFASDDDDGGGDDDDEDGEAAGALAVIVGAIVLATAITGTAVGLAMSPAGRPRDNATTLRTMRMLNDQMKRAAAECASASSPPRFHRALIQ